VRPNLAHEPLAAGRREQPSPARRRLHQSHSEAGRCCNRQALRRNVRRPLRLSQSAHQCWPNGVPFVLSSNGMEMVEKGDVITIIYQTDHQVRHVRMNGTHPASVTPSWYGDSVAHWDGDTLVIDSVGIKQGPFAMVDWFGTPQSPALHVT